MKRTNLSLLLYYLLLFAVAIPVRGQIRAIPPHQIFNTYIKNYNLIYSLPHGFVEIDSIISSEIYPFISKPAPLNRVYINVYNQAYSLDSNNMIIWQIMRITKKDEEMAQKIYSILSPSDTSNYDYSKHFLIRLRGLLQANQGVVIDSLDFRGSDIDFYPKRELKRLGAEVAGEYTLKLTDPYLDYTYLTYRFIVIPYHLDIYTYIFYKEYSEELAKKITKKTKYILRFR